MDGLVALARKTIARYVRAGDTPDPPDPLPPEMSARAGVFVSLKKNGELRGCMGTAIPREENVAREIIANAVSAATRDPRFAPVRPEEVDALWISVDVLSNPEPVSDLGNLDPRRYGVIVRTGHRAIVLVGLLVVVGAVGYAVKTSVANAELAELVSGLKKERDFLRKQIEQVEAERDQLKKQVQILEAARLKAEREAAKAPAKTEPKKPAKKKPPEKKAPQR
ncbi:MAG: AmmeMemoRadiSam system protein A [Nitrospirae bacterium]|nr:AmmeMemoRadiSam system protein A [Nitrospirota bacterium]